MKNLKGKKPFPPKELHLLLFDQKQKFSRIANAVHFILSFPLKIFLMRCQL